MVLGLRTKNRRSATIQVDYLIHVQEIKPWPPSQSLRTLRSVLLQWENGDRSSGSTSSVVPSLGSGVGDGKIEFNESFRLPVTLSRDMSIKGSDADAFQKNCLEFNLYEPRRDKTVKGQLLGTVIIDLADYGVVKETLSLSAPMNCKRSFSNTAQPVLIIKIQPVDKARPRSSLRDSPSKDISLDKNGGESVSTLMNEEYAEEAEIASLTDDDVSSHSSLTISLTTSSSAHESNGVLPRQKEENGSKTVKDSSGGDIKEHASPSKPGLVKSDMLPVTAPHENQKGSSSCSSSIDLSSDPGSPVNGHASLSNFSESSVLSIPEEIVAPAIQSSSSSIAYKGPEEESSSSARSNDPENFAQEVHEKVAYCCSDIKGNAEQSAKENISDTFSTKVASPNADSQAGEKLNFKSSLDSQVNEGADGNAWRPSRNGLVEGAAADDNHNGPTEDKDGNNQQENGQERQVLGEEKRSTEDESINRFSRDAARKQVSSGSDTLSYWKGNILTSDRLRHVKSVRSLSDSSRSNVLVNSNQFMVEVKEAGVLRDAQNGARLSFSNERKDAKVYPKETKNTFSDSKIQQLEHRIKMLEGELREAAAIEVALYSVVAEHGSSMSKVHAPARRLSRLYLHACKESVLSRRATAARTAVSGLVLVAKACGNDVPRLTYWLSNSVILRAIISQVIGELELPLSAGLSSERNGGGKVNKERSSPLKWKESSPSMKENKNVLYEMFGDWGDPHTFTSALEKIEAWIFYRIIESVWWQTLIPHMQSAAAKAIDSSMSPNLRKHYGRTSSSGDQERGNFSAVLWKKAFKDACERLCPVRAGGHECGCLPVLARLIMEQCVARLDVAMFNAILRESADEIPTDPVSDPISDSRVLPIPAGKSSFGAGALLKNAIGNWSRWLTDLFGMDDDESFEDENNHNDDDDRRDTSFKSFHLLNALSDLMMLPKDMLLSRSIRKEVCPTFGAPLIKRVLDSFIPDEFCPDPIPEAVLEALDSEDSLETGDEVVPNVPCIAAPIVYLPPSAASLAGIIGEIRSPELRRSGSSILRKSYTSDDELDELDSPLTSIIIDGFRASPTPTKPNSMISKENGSRSAVRYQLLREVWMNSA